MGKRITNQGVASIAASAQIPRIQFSSGAARLLQNFSDKVFAIGGQLNDQLDQAAAAEAAEEGAIVGASPGGFEKQSYETIRGRAFNQAAVSSFMTTIETNMIGKVAELERQYSNDPAALKTALDNYGRGFSNEIQKVHPAAAAVLSQQYQMRSLPAVERARDARFKLTRDKADASLIGSQVAIQAELKKISADLFSDNPTRSALASQQVAALRAQIMGVYNATDADGKPLYSAAQKAEANQKFLGEVMESASLSWFDNQPDSTAAYFKFIEGDFSIKLNSPGIIQSGDDITAYMVEGKQGAAHAGLKPSFRKRFASLMSTAPPAIRNGLKLFSGHRSIAHQRELWNDALAKYGTAQEARKWVAPPGKSKHGTGAAGDLSFNGVRLDQADSEARQWVHENAPKHGLNFRLENEPWHVEVDEAFEEQGSDAEIDIRSMLDPAKVKQIEGAMRERIRFDNSQTDRDDRKEQEETLEQQRFAHFALVDALANGDPAVDRNMIKVTVDNKVISPDMGRAMLASIAKENAPETNEVVRKELLARMELGENVQSEILRQKDQFTNEDFRQLLGDNRRLNMATKGGEFTEVQDFYFKRLSSALRGGGGPLEQFDPTSARRKMNALTEYRHRVLENEVPEEVMRNILDRAERDGISFATGRLATMLTPRFAVVDPVNSGKIDIQASSAGLMNAFKGKQISESAFNRQVELLREWQRLQQVAGSK